MLKASPFEVMWVLKLVFEPSKGCRAGSTLGAGAGELVISGGNILLFSLFGNIGRNGKFESKAELYFSAKYYPSG